jgi:hypothetical protein
MASKNIKKTENNFQVENNEQSSTKRSLAINLSHEVNKKNSISTSRHYKVLLTCDICNGDAHGN